MIDWDRKTTDRLIDRQTALTFSTLPWRLRYPLLKNRSSSWPVAECDSGAHPLQLSLHLLTCLVELVWISLMFAQQAQKAALVCLTKCHFFICMMPPPQIWDKGFFLWRMALLPSVRAQNVNVLHWEISIFELL